MNAVKIPNDIAIGATRASIIFKPNLKGDDGYDGTFNKRTGELALDVQLIGEKLDKTFMHELLEVIKENYCLDVDEKTMSMIGHGLLEFLWQLGIEFDFSDIETCE